MRGWLLLDEAKELLTRWLGCTVTGGMIALLAVCQVSTAQAKTKMSCSTDVTGQVMAARPSLLGNYSCGVPFAGLPQGEPEDVYEFTCEINGDVTVLLTNMDCNLDIYVLDNTCQPGAGCLEGETSAFSIDDSVTFSCISGVTYAIIIEGRGFGGGCTPSGGNYNLDVEVGAWCRSGR